MRNRLSMKVLHENNFGYIAKCKCCSDLQLNLGNVIVTFSTKEYADFDLFFNEIREDFSLEIEDGSSRKYIIRTNLNNLVLSLSYQELQDTIEILNFSNIMLSVNQLTKGINEK